MHTTTLFNTTLVFRALTDDDLSSLLASRCATQVSDILDRCEVTGNNFDVSAAAEIADLVINAGSSLMVEIVVLGAGISSDQVGRLSPVDRLIASLRIVELTLANTTIEELSKRVLFKFFTSAARTSAMASGNGVRH